MSDEKTQKVTTDKPAGISADDISISGIDISETVDVQETKLVEPVVETQDENIEEITRQEIEDQLAEATASDDAEPEPVEEEPSDEEPLDPVEERIQRIQEKSQKRIDQLVAQRETVASENESLREEIRGLKDAVTKMSESRKESPSYTFEQLDSAYEKAFAEGDVELMREVRKQERENYRRELAKAVESYKPTSKKESIELPDNLKKEWNIVHGAFVSYSDPSGEEIYPNSRQELNIMDPNSKLFQLAKAKYQSDEKYRKQNGMVQAVTDAFNEIIRIRMGGKVSETVLKDKVKKLQVKASQGASKSMAGRAKQPSKPKTYKEQVDDYIKFRRSL